MALGDKNPLWRSPRHHLDLPGTHEHVHWVELFYDLIHVVMIFLLGNFLSHHHDLAGFIAFAMLFSAMWLAWGESSVYNSLICLALVCFVVFRFVPSIIGNLIWASAVVVVLLAPISRAYIVLSSEQRS